MPKKTPQSDVNLSAVEDALQAAGWVCDGRQETSSYRTTTIAFAGSIVKTGGRMRWRRDNRRCTTGKRTVCFFTKEAGKEPSGFVNKSVLGELDSILELIK